MMMMSSHLLSDLVVAITNRRGAGFGGDVADSDDFFDVSATVAEILADARSSDSTLCGLWTASAYPLKQFNCFVKSKSKKPAINEEQRSQQKQLDAF